MSRVFYDHLIDMKSLEKEIKKISSNVEEKHEIWSLIDEIIHHKVLHCVLDNLEKKHHKKFLVKLHESPHDEDILKYLQKKIKIDIEEFIIQELKSIEHEILKDLGSKKRIKRKKAKKGK